MRLPISAFIICQNEEEVIEGCIRSLWMCREIVVVDGGSVDGTLDILERLRSEGAPLRLFREPFRGFGAQKQFALDQCREEWCLSIDSDERVSGRLAAALGDMIARDDLSGWRITRFDYLTGYGYVPAQAKERYHNRLFRRGAGRFDPSDLVHEGIHIDGKCEKAPGGLLHFHPITLERQIQKANRYSTLKAEMKKARGIAPRPWKMLVSPVVFFLRWYVGNQHFRCGWAGFISAANGAVYSYLTEAKRWEMAALDRVPPVEPKEPPDY